MGDDGEEETTVVVTYYWCNRCRSMFAAVPSALVCPLCRQPLAVEPAGSGRPTIAGPPIKIGRAPKQKN